MLCIMIIQITEFSILGQLDRFFFLINLYFKCFNILHVITNQIGFNHDLILGDLLIYTCTYVLHIVLINVK